MNFIEWLRIDDPVGAVSVHGVCGIWGTLSLGLFASGQYGVTGVFAPDNSAPVTGLFYGGGTSVLAAQAIGTFTIAIAVFAVTFIMMKVINALPHPWKLRIEEEGELGVGGIDIFDHGMEVYPNTDEDISLSGLFDKGAKVTA